MGHRLLRLAGWAGSIAICLLVWRGALRVMALLAR